MHAQVRVYIYACIHTHVRTLTVVMLKYIIWDWRHKAEVAPELIVKWLYNIYRSAPLKREGNLQIDLFNF